MQRNKQIHQNVSEYKVPRRAKHMRSVRCTHRPQQRTILFRRLLFHLQQCQLKATIWPTRLILESV
jgi:hypothetical protein